MKNKKVWIIIGIIGAIVLVGLIALLIINPFKNKYIPNINNIQIEYVPGFDYNKAEEMNKNENTKIEIQTIKLSDKDQKNIKKQINKISQKIKKKEFETLYKVEIDKNNILYIGKEITQLQSKHRQKQ